jgi:hypothetical protein
MKFATFSVSNLDDVSDYEQKAKVAILLQRAILLICRQNVRVVDPGSGQSSIVYLSELFLLDCGLGVTLERWYVYSNVFEEKA